MFYRRTLFVSIDYGGTVPHGSDTTRRPALSRAAIVAEALRIVDAEGVDAVSMRRVADHFGTGPASLYAHVSNREELLLLAADEVAAEVPLPEVNPRRWRVQLLQLLTDIRAAMVRHGDIAAMSIGRIPVHPHTLRIADRMMGLLAAGGMPPKDAALAADLLPLYVVAVAFEEGVEAVTGRRNGEDYHQQVAEVWSQLPPADYPAVTALMPHLFTAGDADERFRFGLEVLLDGLVARAARGRTRRK